MHLSYLRGNDLDVALLFLTHALHILGYVLLSAFMLPRLS